MSGVLAILSPHFEKIEAVLNNDGEFQASITGKSVTFGLKTSGAEQLVLISISQGSIKISSSDPCDSSFVLSARSYDWRNFFEAVPARPWQSYWGILRVLGHEEGVDIQGDMMAFSRYARVWRLMLDRSRDVIHGSSRLESGAELVYDDGDGDDDALTGRYIWVDLPDWGRSKVFYESAGTGSQDILFLHTAGADSRQFHTLMEKRKLRQRCTMYAFDLPGHGRSYPGSKQVPQGYTNDEEQYVETIGQVIKKLKLRNAIVSGASMAGHACLAVAIRAKELGVSGVIPCEATDHLPQTQPIYDLPGDVDEAMLNPERVCGMIAPSAPDVNKRLIWWIYSSQAIGMFHGDLKFYFQGWDGRGRVEKIDTRVCPVYMLTGEYDYSCTAEASEATAARIPGAVFEKMQGLGHFPMTEDPDVFLPYLLDGIDHIQAVHRKD